jgi:hypothetical protein
LTDTLVLLSTGAEAEGSNIPSAVPVEDVAPETQEAAGEAPEPMELAAGVKPRIFIENPKIPVPSR